MRYVKYIGPSHIRQITTQDWRSVGIQADTMVWTAQNGFAVPLDSLTEDQIRVAIEPDQYFVITGDEDEEFVPTPQRADMTPAQLEQVTTEPVDVVDVMEGRQEIVRDDSGDAKVVPSGGVTKETGPK